MKKTVAIGPIVIAFVVSLSCWGQGQPPVNGTVNGATNGTPCPGCLAGESSVTVRTDVAHGDYVFSENPPCNADESLMLQGAERAIGSYLKDPDAAKQIIAYAGPKVQEVVNQCRGDFCKFLEPVTGTKIANCQVLCASFPDGWEYRGYVKWANDEHGTAACNNEQACDSYCEYNPSDHSCNRFHDTKWNMGWSGWDGLDIKYQDNGASSACMIFKNWSNDRTRNVAVTYYLKPKLNQR
jgi:hypothetical protein